MTDLLELAAQYEHQAIYTANRATNGWPSHMTAGAANLFAVAAALRALTQATDIEGG